MSALGIINGISQVLANMHDGAIDDEGEPIELGLKREEVDPATSARTNDGFSAKILPQGQLCIYYNLDGIKLKEVADKNFESDCNDHIEKIKSFIQKEYKKVTGKSLTLKQAKDTDVCTHVEYISRVRTSVKAHKIYEIGGIDLESEEVPQYVETGEHESSFKKFLEQGGWGDGKPSNVKAKKDKHEYFDPYSL